MCKQIYKHTHIYIYMCVFSVWLHYPFVLVMELQLLEKLAEDFFCPFTKQTIHCLKSGFSNDC